MKKDLTRFSTSTSQTGSNRVEISGRADCEVRGEVGKGPEKVCGLPASWDVSVEGLSPVKCCQSHSRAMKKFWGVHYEVVSVKIVVNMRDSLDIKPLPELSGKARARK